VADPDLVESFKHSFAAMDDHITYNKKKPCRHKDVELWHDASAPMRCKICEAVISDEDRVAQELKKAAEASSQDGDDVELNTDRCHRRGVTVSFLVAFTAAHDCWEWPTWRVVRDIICAATEDNRCRYTDLDVAKDHIGPATVFASHCWGAPWGDLVAAVCCHADSQRRIWIDVFAVRQWPGNGADLHFVGIMRRCNAFMLATTLVPDVAALSKATASEADRKMLAICRLWCLMEIGAALQLSKPVVIKAGSHVVNPEDGSVRFEPNNMMLDKMLHMIDVMTAETTVPADRVQIINKVEFDMGGAEALNLMVKGAITGAQAINALHIPELEAAACSETRCLTMLPDFKFQENMREVLTAAAGGNYMNIVEHALANGATIDMQDDKDLTPLTAAAQAGHEAMVVALVAQGADVNLQGSDGFTSLMFAAEGGHEGMVVALVAKGAEVDVQSKHGNTALMYATQAGHEAAVNALLAEGADVNLQGRDGFTSLMFAAEGRGGGHGEIVGSLVAKGAVVSTQDSEGLTALMHACIAGHEAAVEALLGGKAEAEQDKDGARQRSSSQGKMILLMDAVVGVLLARETAVNTQDKEGMTALMHAARAQNGHKVVVGALLASGAAVNAQDNDGFTALMHACIANAIAVVEVLVARGATVDTPDKDGFTALMHSSMVGHDSVVDILAAWGAMVNAQGCDNVTALMAASQKGHASVVEVLVTRGAELNAQGIDGVTALMAAASAGHKAVVEVLVAAGANVNGKGQDGATALDYADEEGHQDVVKLLQDAGALELVVCTTEKG